MYEVRGLMSLTSNIQQRHNVYMRKIVRWCVEMPKMQKKIRRSVITISRVYLNRFQETFRYPEISKCRDVTFLEKY